MNSVRYRYVTAGYALLILSVSTLSGRTVQDLIFGWDKAYHLLEYSVLGGLLIKSLSQWDFKRVTWAGMAGSLFAAVDESWQGMITDRFSSIFDWVADTVGVVTGIGLVLLFARLRHASEKAG